MRKSFFAVLCAVCVTFLNHADIFAINSANLQVSPASTEIQLTPNEQYEGSFDVENVGDVDFNFKVTIEPYNVADIDYSPDFATKTSHNQIVDWISLDENTGFVPAKSLTSVHYKISVPNDVPAGGQYAVFMVSLTSSEDSSLKVIGRVGSIIYAHVSGNTEESGNLLSHKINPLYLKTAFTETSIENTGNVDFDVTITTKATNLLSNKTVYDNSNAPVVIKVLPKTTRLERINWRQSSVPGIFKISEEVQFLDQKSTLEKIVVMCPIWLLLSIAFSIVLIILLIILKTLAHFNHKR